MQLYHVYYCKNGVSHCRTALNMDYPSESLAIELLLKQHTILPSDKVYIEKIEK